MVTVITGATSGIGKETARGLAAAGMDIVMLARNADKAQAVKAELLEESEANIEIVAADLGALASIKKAATQIQKKHKHVDCLINNAGLTHPRRHLTEDGYEATFAVNHLAPFLLTSLLLPALKKSKSARIVTVSSRLHKRGKIHFDNLMLERGYNLYKAYNQSKLANIMFTYELARRLDGQRVTANCVHPGDVATDIARDFPSFFVGLVNRFMLSAEEGAQPSLQLALSPQLEGVSGKYFNRMNEEESAPLSYDRAAAERLWKVSNDLVGHS